MSNYQNDLLMRCLPDGRITRVNPDVMRMLEDQCHVTHVDDKNAFKLLTEANRVADIARTNGYYGTALSLYKKVFKAVQSGTGEVNGKHLRLRIPLYDAAKGIDKIMSALRPNQWRKNHAYHKAVYYFMSYYDDYCYSIRNVDLENLDELDEYSIRYDVGDTRQLV